jgi:hypothetical protein
MQLSSCHRRLISSECIIISENKLVSVSPYCPSTLFSVSGVPCEIGSKCDVVVAIQVLDESRYFASETSVL